MQNERLQSVRQNPSRIETHDRLTTILMMRHEHFGEDPRSMEARYHVWLEGQEQPFERRLVVGESWAPLSGVWASLLADAGTLALENRPPTRTVNPTPEELEDDAAAIVDVGLVVAGEPRPCLRVSPGRAEFFEPIEGAEYQVRCRRGRANLYVWAYPR